MNTRPTPSLRSRLISGLDEISPDWWTRFSEPEELRYLLSDVKRLTEAFNAKEGPDKILSRVRTVNAGVLTLKDSLAARLELVLQAAFVAGIIEPIREEEPR